MKARGARVVVFDELFDDPSPIPKVDEQFGESIREHGRVVLAMSVQKWRGEGRPPALRVLRPLSTIGAGASWGIVEWPAEAGKGGTVRRHSNYLDFTNLAWQAAVAFGKAPSDRLTPRYLNFYGPEGTVPTVSYHRALNASLLPPDFFARKAVFVGGTGIITAQGQIAERYPTPFFGQDAGQIPGVELQATAFLNLIRGDWLQEFSPTVELLLVLIAGALFGFGLPRFQPWIAAGVAIAAAAIIAGATVLLAWYSHRWFPWVIVSLVQVPCALISAVVLHTLRLTGEKEVLEKDVALAESVASLPSLLLNESARGKEMPAPGYSPTANAYREEAPPPIPNHRMIRRIGRGAYGEVWLARDDIGTHHAVKVVYQRGFSSAAPYEREFRGIQKFTPLSRSHPGFVNILHVGRNDPDGYFFYIMELGDDEQCGQRIDPATYSPNTLAKRLEAGGRLPLADCVRLGLDLTAALDHLHQQKLIHRDIKPSNIIFVNGAPKFADVGLVTDITPRGKDSTFVGTEGYLAPEGPGTVAADIYSLGMVLYEACTGQDRQQYPALSGTLLATGGPELALLNEVILKACHPQTKQRYQTAAQMHEHLSAIQKRFSK
jgi:CHASE2 domain-containing sensor protein